MIGPKKEFRFQKNYCILSEGVSDSMPLFKKMVMQRMPSLMLTSVHPAKLRERYGLEGVQVIWLSEEASKGARSIAPARIRFEVSKEMNAFISSNKEGVIFLEGVDFLVQMNGFDEVLKFAKQVLDKASGKTITTLMSINPKSIPESQFTLFKQMFDECGWANEFLIVGGEKTKILVVDDDDLVRDALSALLEDAGHKVRTSPSGEDGLEIMKKEGFDIAFIDLRLPGIGGIEVLSKMKTSGIAAIPIMITGFASVDTAIEAMRMGAFEYIQKPFEFDQIDHVLKKAIEELKRRGVAAPPIAPASKPATIPPILEAPVLPERERAQPSKKGGIRRRLQKVGRSTLALTLPKEWADKTSAKPGDEVIIEINPDGSIKIVPESMEAAPLSQLIRLDEGESSPENWLSSAIATAYDQGTESMTLKFKEDAEDEVRSVLDRLLLSLPGLSIVEEGKGKMMLQCFIDVSKYSFSGLIRRMLLLEGSMIAQIVGDPSASPQKDSAASPKEIERVKNLILRQCFRALRDKPFAAAVGITSDADAVSNAICVYALSRISKRLHHLAMLQEKAQIPEGIRQALSELRPIITGLVEANITPKPFDQIGKLTEDLSKLEDRVDTMLASGSKTKRGSDDAQLHLVGLFLVTILQFTAQIAESALLKRGSRELTAEKH